MKISLENTVLNSKNKNTQYFYLKKKNAEEVRRKKGTQRTSSADPTAQHIQKQTSTEPASTDRNLRINGSLSAEN